jgi:CrcB protein
MKEIAIVFVGGGLGSALRFGVGKLLISSTSKFPMATFLVNMMGCLLIGLLIAFFSKSENNFYKLLLVTGFCGGFTTFSTFSNETILLLKNNQIAFAVIYILSSLIVGLLATFLGYLLMQKFL